MINNGFLLQILNTKRYKQQIRRSLRYKYDCTNGNINFSVFQKKKLNSNPFASVLIFIFFNLINSFKLNYLSKISALISLVKKMLFDLSKTS